MTAMPAVPAVTRLVTHVELDEDETSAAQFSASARLEAELSDGRALVLLDDRGWSESGPEDIRAYLTRASVEDTARTVVGPDEPFADETPEQAATAHWTSLADSLAGEGVVVDAAVLANAPHDVVLSERLRTWAAFD
ncbi:hypothetical protein [Streptomyces sp. NPDC058486]|uniref:hypothetical protein n=1 Tax=unclassified Streptomyces TaxID=2593676 RepID=UPI00366168BD